MPRGRSSLITAIVVISCLGAAAANEGDDARSAASAAGSDVVAAGPPGLVVNGVSPAPQALFWERLTLENRTAFTLDFSNKTGSPLTFTSATAFLLDEENALLGTTGIDADTFASTRSISDVGNLFFDGRALTNISSASSEGARDLAVDAFGFVTAGIAVHSSSGNYRIPLVRYKPDGSEDGTFGGSGKVLANVTTSLNEGAEAVAIDAAGRIVVAGFAEPVLGQKQLLVARFLSNGDFDGSFNGTGWLVIDAGGTAEATAVAVDGEGRIVAGGRVETGAGDRFALVRVLDNGALDTTFGGDGIVDADIGAQSERLEALAIDAAGRIVAAGRGALFGSDRFVVARYNDDGGFDGTFGIGGATLTTFPGASSVRAFALVITPSGRMVVAGEGIVSDHSAAAVARYNEDGTLDANFDADGRVLVDVTALGSPGSLTTSPLIGIYARDVMLDPIGRIVLAGPGFTTNSSRMAVVRLNGIGQLDPSFGGDGTAFVSFDGLTDSDAFGVVGYTDDTIVIAGTAFASAQPPTTAGGYVAIARMKPNGTLYTVLDPETSVPNGARVKLPFPFNNFPRKLTPATINVQVFFEELAQPLFITGISPIFFEQDARPYLFPLRNPAVGFWRPGQGHDIHENHYGNPSQRYAYDISVYDPEKDTGVNEDCDVEALIAQYANDPLYDYDIDPDGTYEAKEFAECSFSYGEPVYAAAAGAVVAARDGMPNNFPVPTKLPELYLPDSDPNKIGGGGNSVIINHGNGEFTFYAHMRPGSVQVSAGQNVLAGQLLGYVGNTGSSAGAHLHFHLMDNWVPTPTGPPDDEIAQAAGQAPGHGLGLPVYFYNLNFPAGGASAPLRQLRSGFNTGTMVDVDPEPVPIIDVPAPQFGPGVVAEAEPNYTLPNAQRLVLPVEVHGSIGSFEQVDLADAGDGIEDIYRFRITQGATVVARLTFTGGQDLDLLLVNSLLYASDPKEGTRLHNPEVVVANLPPGTHYAFVSRFDDSAPGTTEYQLEIEIFTGSSVGYFESLSVGLWNTPGTRRVTLAALRSISREVDAGRVDRALELLRDLGARFDGCMDPAAAGDDYLADCEAQRGARELIERMIRDLDSATREVR